MSQRGGLNPVHQIGLQVREKEKWTLRGHKCGDTIRALPRAYQQL